MTEPKLLTEAEWHIVLARPNTSQIIDDLRERGMIAPEPVDPLAREAGEIADAVYAYKDPERAYAKNAALTALRRGMERPTLTREMVREAVDSASRLTPMRETFVDCVYALLVERLK